VAEPKQGSRVIAHWKALAAMFSLIVVGNVLLHVFVIRKDVRVSGDREAILAGERRELADLEADVASLENTVSKIACTRADERNVFENLISGKSSRMTAVLRELHQLAEEMRVEPGRLAFTRSRGERNGLVRFSASLSFDAPYSVLHEFIERIENSPNFLFIEQVGLTGARRAGDDLRLQLRISTWFQGPDLERLDASLVSTEEPS
jgi:hypothetical protein